MGELIYLISDLMAPGGKNLRQKFNSSPEKVMDDYGLSAEARAALVCMDKSEISCIIEQELEDWQFPAGEFPPVPEADCSVDEEQALYPEPHPRVYKIDPASGGSGQNVIVKVNAQGLVRNATLFYLSSPSSAQYPTGGIWVTVTGTFRCGSFQQQITLPSVSAKTVYMVKVAIGRPGDAETCELPGKVTFTVG